MNANILTNRWRAHYNTLKEKFNNTNVYPDFVRVEKRISNTSSNYQFNLQKLAIADPAVNRVNQKGVEQNDLFVALDIAFFIDARVIAEQSTASLRTFPDTEAFAPATISVGDLMTIYNGQFNFSVNNQDFIPSGDMYQFLNVPGAQENQLITQDGTYLSGWDISKAFVPIEPTIVVSGKTDASITVNLNLFTGIDIASTVGTVETVLTCYLRGYTVNNAADNFQELRKQLGWAK